MMMIIIIKKIINKIKLKLNSEEARQSYSIYFKEKQNDKKIN